MRKHIESTSLPVFALSLMVLGTMLPGTLSVSGARAADECVARPNAPAPAGQHWWYSTDRATKRKCWFLGPQDKAAAALKADRQEQAAAPAVRPEAQPASTQDLRQDSSLAPVARSEANGIQPFAPVAAQGIPFQGVPHLVDWSELLQEAGIVSSKDNALTEWAADKSARTAWAMRDESVREPMESQAGKGDARAPQTAAADADIANGVAKSSTRDLAATPAQMPATFIAALVIIGGMCLTIFGIVRTQRRIHFQPNVDARVQPNVDARAINADEGTLPAFLQQHDARSVPSGQGDSQEYGQAQDQEYGRGYGGEEELRRILGYPQRRAA